jgi:hypothetical protein
MIQFDALANGAAVTEPFPYMVCKGLLRENALADISKDFPEIEQPGVFPLSELSYGPAFADLIDEICSKEMEEILARKFAIDLAHYPLMITVRGQTQARDGQIHTDSTDKVLTCLLYLNEPSWNERSGCLRLLRDGENLDNMIAEVPPDGGTFLGFKRSENSWHGHLPFIGRRRAVMFNWMRSELALARNVGRHRLSSMFKKLLGAKHAADAQS